MYPYFTIDIITIDVVVMLVIISQCLFPSNKPGNRELALYQRCAYTVMFAGMVHIDFS